MPQSNYTDIQQHTYTHHFFTFYSLLTRQRYTQDFMEIIILVGNRRISQKKEKSNRQSANTAANILRWLFVNTQKYLFEGGSMIQTYKISLFISIKCKKTSKVIIQTKNNIMVMKT